MKQGRTCINSLQKWFCHFYIYEQLLPLYFCFLYFIVEAGLTTLECLLFNYAIIDGTKNSKFTITGLLPTYTNWYIDNWMQSNDQKQWFFFLPSKTSIHKSFCISSTHLSLFLKGIIFYSVLEFRVENWLFLKEMHLT